jgi:hypothetical protein
MIRCLLFPLVSLQASLELFMVHGRRSAARERASRLEDPIIIAFVQNREKTLLTATMIVGWKLTQTRQTPFSVSRTNATAPQQVQVPYSTVGPTITAPPNRSTVQNESRVSHSKPCPKLTGVACGGRGGRGSLPVPYPPTSPHHRASAKRRGDEDAPTVRYSSFPFVPTVAVI